MSLTNAARPCDAQARFLAKITRVLYQGLYQLEHMFSAGTTLCSNLCTNPALRAPDGPLETV